MHAPEEPRRSGFLKKNLEGEERRIFLGGGITVNGRRRREIRENECVQHKKKKANGMIIMT